MAIAGCKLWLLAGKALYWPERQTLCVADVHFGKAASYRALGQPVPHGTTEGNLLRLDALLTSYPVKELIFLGDFLHSRTALNQKTLAALHEWRSRHPNLKCTLIRGNHDLNAGDPPESLELRVVNEPLNLEPFFLQHTPAINLKADLKFDSNSHVIAGHIHPMFQLTGRGKQRLRLPCFHVTKTLTVLPSFGEFTGGHQITLTASSFVFVTDGNGIWPIANKYV